VLWISDKDHETSYGDKTVASEMALDQLTKKLHCGLEYISTNNGDAQHGANINFKELEKQKEP